MGAAASQPKCRRMSANDIQRHLYNDGRAALPSRYIGRRHPLRHASRSAFSALQKLADDPTVIIHSRGDAARASRARRLSTGVSAQRPVAEAARHSTTLSRAEKLLIVATRRTERGIVQSASEARFRRKSRSLAIAIQRRRANESERKGEHSCANFAHEAP